VNEKDKDDIRFLLALVPDWAKSMPYPSMDPSLYGTHSYEGDKKVVERVKHIREKLLEEKDE